MNKLSLKLDFWDPIKYGILGDFFNVIWTYEHLESRIRMENAHLPTLLDYAGFYLFLFLIISIYRDDKKERDGH